MTTRTFGRLPGGETVTEVALAGDGLEVELLTYGASIRGLRLSTSEGARSVVLGFDRLEPYLDPPAFFGAVVGRVANRIAGGRLELDGASFALDLNEEGRTHLHGGSGGFSSRNWTLAQADGRSAVFELVSPDGDQGYPGTVTVRCRYEISGPGTLALELTATTDRATVVGLATHSYFDLDRGEDILGHVLTIPAEAVTPVDERLVPTGAVLPVAGTALDFRAPRPIGAAGGLLDINYALAAAPVAEPRLVARVEGPASGLVLEVHSTEPGLQAYDGNMTDLEHRFPDGRRAGRHCGFCLEPQCWPDAVHHPHFPSVVLRPGETYRQRTEYRISSRRG